MAIINTLRPSTISFIMRVIITASYMKLSGRLALCLAWAGAACAATRNFDVVVYGGTAGGVIAAVSAARQGLKTALVEPTAHLGGMVSGGLGWTDYGKKEVIGGYALEFYWRVGTHYQMARYGNDIAWLHEPHVAESIFRDMLRAAGVAVFERQRLREKTGVRKNGPTVAAITTEDGSEFTASVFIDAGYEGDLMAQAGVSYTFGREGSAQYGESLAGVRDKTPFHQFLVDLSPKDARGNLLPEISAARPEPPGSADKRVQAYNYRMCFSDVPENRRAFPRPARYDAGALRAAGAPDRGAATEGRPRAAAGQLHEDRPPAQRQDRRQQQRRRSPPTISAAATSIPTGRTRDATRSRRRTASTSPACSISSRTTRRFPRRCARR